MVVSYYGNFAVLLIGLEVFFWGLPVANIFLRVVCSTRADGGPESGKIRSGNEARNAKTFPLACRVASAGFQRGVGGHS